MPSLTYRVGNDLCVVPLFMRSHTQVRPYACLQFNRAINYNSNTKTPDYSGVFSLSIFFKNQIQNGIEVTKVKISARGWAISTPSILK